MPKHALLVGINYFGQRGELNGCINNVNSIKEVLISKFGYLEDNITMLTDDQEDVDKQPNAVNIMQNLYNLIAKTHGNVEEIWFHYSGHGTYIKDRSGDEADGNDECLCPVDYTYSGLLRDDDLRDIVKQMNPKCHGTFIMDCCHSGSMLDLKYQFLGSKKLSVVNQKAVAIEAPVLMLSGCRDDQTSADAYIDGKNQGAMTAALLFSLKRLDYSVPCLLLLKEMRRYLRYNCYPQIPQLSSSKEITNVTVFCSKGEMDQYVKM